MELLELLSLYQQDHPHPARAIQEKMEAIDLDFLATDLPMLFASMQLGTERIRNIVLGLRNFSRLDEADMKAVRIGEGIDSALMILQSRLVLTNGLDVQILRNDGDLPLVECYPGELNQALMYILTNAIDALDGAYGTVAAAPICRIDTLAIDADRIAIRITDNGPGISPESLAHIFVPFYTTKAVGSGTGLGLAIAYKTVVEKHQGELRCETELGKGTTFHLEIPISQQKKVEKAIALRKSLR